MVDYLAGHTLVVISPPRHACAAARCCEAQRTQQRRMDDPAGPAQSSPTALLVHTLLCPSRKTDTKLCTLQIYGGRTSSKCNRLAEQATAPTPSIGWRRRAVERALRVETRRRDHHRHHRVAHCAWRVVSARPERQRQVHLAQPAGRRRHTSAWKREGAGAGHRRAEQGRTSRFRADHVGYIFQMFNLIPYLSVLENVCLPCGFSQRRKVNARTCRRRA